MTNAPRMDGGAVSAAYIGTVANLGPMPKPSMNRATNIAHQVATNPCQRHVIADKAHAMKIVPRRPNQWLNGTVSQELIKAQQRYGAELTRPTSQALREESSPMPNWCL
jgi:hypothetical protein